MIYKIQTMRFSFLVFFFSVLSFGQDVNQLDNNDKRHGVWKKNFEGTKQLRYEGEFNHGKEIGLFNFYKLVKKKSVLTATKVFSAEDNSAFVKFLSSRGQTISEGKMVGKKYVGKWTYYHNRSTQIMTLENYNQNGLLQGEKLVYYKNGKLAEKALYKDGKLEGVSEWYSDKGVVLKSFIYENDELHGVAKHYNGKDELLAEGRYKRGKKTGIWKYYEGGKLVDEKNFTKVSKLKKNQ